MTLPATYQDHLAPRVQVEMTAVFESYEKVDIDTGSNYRDRLVECRTHAYFHRHEETGEVKVISNCCRLRWCPFCSDGRKYRIQEEIKTWLPEMRKPKFLTMTVKHNDDPLVDQIQHLYKSFQKFRKLKFVSKNIGGGVWFFQIKQSEKDGRWHPHLHCLIDANFMDRRYLSKLWLEVTGDSVVIDIRKVENEERLTDYIARYAAKPALLSDMDIDDSVEMIHALHGKRLVGTWGTARHLSFRTVKPDDANSWQKLSSWQDVTSAYHNDDHARMIFNAWKTSTPLAAPIRVNGITLLTDHCPDRQKILASDTYRQLSFAFFTNQSAL